MLRFTDTITTPPGGFQYEDSTTGFRVVARGWKDITDKVWKYRVANGGDVSPGWDDRLQAEMCLQMKLQGTTWCQDDEQYHAPSGEGIGLGDILRALSSFGKIIASGVKLVDQAEADRRGAICAGCPLNVEVAGCLGCSGIKGVVEAVRGSLKTTSDDALHGCKVCKCPLKVKTWLPLSSIDNTGLEYPEWCWQRE